MLNKRVGSENAHGSNSNWKFICRYIVNNANMLCYMLRLSSVPKIIRGISDDPKQLFAAANILLHRHNDTKLSTHYLKSDLVERFATFFAKKASHIRTELSSTTASQP